MSIMTKEGRKSIKGLMLGRVLEEDVVSNSITLLSLTLFTDYNELGIKRDTKKCVPVSATAF